MYQNRGNDGKEIPCFFFLHKTSLGGISATHIAEVAELVDAQDSGSCEGFLVLVRFQSSAPTENKSPLSLKAWALKKTTS